MGPQLYKDPQSCIEIIIVWDGRDQSDLAVGVHAIQVSSCTSLPLFLHFLSFNLKFKLTPRPSMDFHVEELDFNFDLQPLTGMNPADLPVKQVPDPDLPSPAPPNVGLEPISEGFGGETPPTTVHEAIQGGRQTRPFGIICEVVNDGGGILRFHSEKPRVFCSHPPFLLHC